MQIFHLSPVDPICDMSDILTEKIESLAKSHARTLILLSAGSWIQVYEHVSKLPEELDCSSITIGLVDERWVPYVHENRNEGQIRNTKLVQSLEHRGALYIPMIHDIKSDVNLNASQISQVYTDMKNEGSNVFITIGIGTDGHIAGILPTPEKSSFDRRYQTPAPVVYYEVRPEETANPHRQRLTITPDFIRSADDVIVYAIGVGKQSALERLQRGNEQINAFPAQILSGLQEKVTLYTDLEI